MHHKPLGGFTLVELMISVSIITVIVAVVIFNYGKFNNDLALSSAGQEMSIAIRQAQSYGINVKESSSGGGDFTKAYGIYFNATSDPSNYYIFVDNDSDTIYDVGSGCSSGSTECVEKIPLRNKITISAVCGKAFGGSSVCPPIAGLTSMFITFLRPNPDAKIFFANSSGGGLSGTYQSGTVVLTSPQGKTLNVTIENTGQISVQ